MTTTSDETTVLTTTSQERSWALAGHLSGILLSVFGPLLVRLAVKDSRFVREHTRESLDLQATVLVFGGLTGAVMALGAASESDALVIIGAAGAAVVGLIVLVNLVGAVIAAVQGRLRRHRGIFRMFPVGWRHLIAIITLTYAIFPLLYVLSTSFATNSTLTGSNRLLQSLDPANYSALFKTHFPDWALNTLVVGGVTSIGTVLMGAAAAYAFSRFRFYGRRVSLTALLIIQMFPQMLAFIALFLLMLSIEDVFPAIGMDTHLGLICIYLGGALGVNTFLMYGFFNTVPSEIDEAAKIDGASHAQIFFTIILRLVAPILAVVGLLSFVSTFSDFVVARAILKREENFTLAVGLYGMVSDQLNANWGVFTAGAVLAAIPVTLLFLFLQRYIVSGLTAGAVKG